MGRLSSFMARSGADRKVHIVYFSEKNMMILSLSRNLIIRCCGHFLGGIKGYAHDSVLYSYGHGFSRFCSETYQYHVPTQAKQITGLSATNPKNLNMVKKLSLAQKCGQNLKSLTTMGSERCQIAGKEV
ncbi:hypothetical protein Bca4012_084246 [Brassica carinata]